MAKKFLSFLGTNAYLHTKYKIDDFISKPVRYVQEALVQHICKDWEENDKIVIFATEGENGSIKKNWENAQINKFDEKAKEFEKKPLGLGKKLKILNLKCKIEMVPIPDGIKEGEIWKIIQIIYDAIENDDELYIDITHSFRYIPMIIPSMITFLKTTKNINLHSIHYGAFEVLGSNQEVTKKDLNERVAPIRELTELYKMIEWSEATNAFLKFGSGQSLIEQINKIDKSNMDKKTKNIFNPLKNGIKNIDEALKFNNVTELKSLTIPKNAKTIDLKKNPNLFALKNLLPQIENFLGQWSDDEAVNGLLAAEWCLDNDRFAQALTFAQEAMITYFCNIFKWNKSNKDHRLAVSFMIEVALGKKPLENHNCNGLSWFDSTKEEILNTLQGINKEILENFLDLSEWRNTINHAKKGDRKSMQKNFPKILENLKKEILES